MSSLLRRIAEAKAAREHADEAYRQAIADALKAGASVRALEDLTGLAMQTISNWGHERGWPTPDQRRQWDAMRIPKFDE